MYKWYHIICLPVSDLLHSVWQSLGPSMLLKMAFVVFFFYGWILSHTTHTHTQRHTHTHIFFIHSPVDGHLGCFHVWLLSTVMQWTWAEPLLLRYRPLCYITHSSSLSLWLSPSWYALGVVNHFKHSLTITINTILTLSFCFNCHTTSKSGSMQPATTAVSVSMLLSPGGEKRTVVQDRIILKSMVSVEYYMVVIYARNLYVLIWTNIQGTLN